MEGSARYLGYVDKLMNAQGNRREHVLLRPLLRSSDDGLTWLPIENPRVDFPNRGMITWFTDPASVALCSLWEFDREEQPYRPASSDHDRYRVRETPAPPWVLLDCRSEVKGTLRTRLLQNPFDLPHVPPKGQTYLWSEDDCCLGPVSFVPEAPNPLRFRLSPPDGPLVARYAPPLSRLAKLGGDISMHCLAPNADVGGWKGSVDWTPDDGTFLANVIRDLSLMDQAIDASATSSISMKEVAEALGQYEELAGKHPDPMLFGQRMRRAKSLVTQLDKRSNLAQGLVSDLLKVPTVRSRLDRECKRAKQAVLASDTEGLTAVRKRVEEAQSAVESAKGDLLKVQGEINARKDDLAAIEELVRETQSDLTNQATIVDETLAVRLAEITKRPEQSLAEVLIFRAALGIDGRERTLPEGSAAPIPLCHFAWSDGQPNGMVRLSDLKALRTRVRAISRSRDLAAESLRQIHAGFLAGAMPVVAGAQAYDALEGYASCVAGARLIWIPVSPTVVEPADLLGRLDPATRQLMPAPNGLLDLLIEADGSERLYVVVLDGIDRSAIDAYLLPILASYRDHARGRSARSIALALPESLAEGDPRRAGAWLRWPENVLLAGTLSDASSSLPVPASLWTMASLVNLEAVASSADDGRSASSRVPSGVKGAVQGPSEVPNSVWREWRESLDDLGTSKLDELFEAADADLWLKKGRGRVIARFFAAAQKWQEDAKPAVDDTLACCLIPQLLDKTEELGKLINHKSLGPSVEDLARTLQLARRLLR